MKRDCGEGELIPHKWEVVTCVGKSDDDSVTEFAHLSMALIEYEKQKQAASIIKCSDARLYAKDKQGYCNCMKSFIHSNDGSFSETNRMNEL